MVVAAAAAAIVALRPLLPTAALAAPHATTVTATTGATTGTGIGTGTTGATIGTGMGGGLGGAAGAGLQSAVLGAAVRLHVIITAKGRPAHPPAALQAALATARWAADRAERMGRAVHRPQPSRMLRMEWLHGSRPIEPSLVRSSPAASSLVAGCSALHTGQHHVSRVASHRHYRTFEPFAHLRPSSWCHIDWQVPYATTHRPRLQRRVVGHRRLAYCGARQCIMNERPSNATQRLPGLSEWSW